MPEANQKTNGDVVKSRRNTLKPVGSDEWKRHPDLYMPDGTMVLLTSDVVFKVYPGLLAMHSDVFKGMTSLSKHEPEEAEKYDGCSLVRLTDDPEDLAHFLKATMGISHFHAHRPTPFPVAAAILRLASKYMVESLREQAIRHFGRVIPKSFDEIGKIESYKDVFGENNIPHPFTIHTLFRQCQLIPYLPWSFYMACNEGFYQLVNGVIYNDEAVRLKGDDYRVALSGWKRLYDKTRTIRISTILSRGQGCAEDICTHQIRLSFAETATYHIRSDALSQWGMFKMLAAGIHPSRPRSGDNLAPCQPCVDLWLRTEKAERQQVWNTLPSYFELPAWDELKMDI